MKAPKYTKREKEVLGLIVQGFINGEIGEKLEISERTVETYRRNIIMRSGCDNMYQVCYEAGKLNLV